MEGPFSTSLMAETGMCRWIGYSFHGLESLNSVYVVVKNFLSQLIFIFLLFLGIVMYANKFETKEK